MGSFFIVYEQICKPITAIADTAVVPKKRTVVLSVETAPLKMQKVISSDGDIDE